MADEAPKSGLASFFSWLPDWVRIASTIFFIGMLCVVVIGAPIVLDYWYREALYADAMPLFFGIAVAIVLVFALLAGRAVARGGGLARERDLGDSPRRAFPLWAKLAIAMAVLLVAQALIVRYCFFVTNWDVGNVSMRYGEETLESYLAIYPFQEFLLGIFRIVSAPMGPLASNGAYLALVLLGVALVDLSLVLLMLTARRLFGEAWAWLAFALGVWFCGISPWILVPYTDTYTMLFPMAVIFCYTCWLPEARVRPVVWGVMAFLSVVGYALKPTSIFAIVCVVAVALCRSIARQRAYRPKHEAGSSGACRTSRSQMARGAYVCCGFAVGAAVAFGLVGVVSDIGVADLQVEEGRGFGIPHYLMMGSSYGGGYTKEDVALSESIASPSERTQAELDVWLDRLGEMGIGGTQALAVRKALTTFASGSFTWGQEGNFFNNFPLGGMNLLHRFYGIPTREQIDAGELDSFTSYEGAPAHTAPYFVISQVLWLALLLSLCLEIVDRRAEDPLCAAFAALFALGVFLLVFECRARYLILYLPLFSIAAVSGLRALTALVARRFASGDAEDA